MVERPDGQKPITDEHQLFAQELVALARKHGASQLTVQFSLTGGRRFFDGQYNSTRVDFTWSEGRHGDRSVARLRAEASVEVNEATPNPDPSNG